MITSKSPSPLSQQELERREKILQRMAALEASLKRLDFKEKKVEKTRLARQKIILGGWLMANDQALVEKIKGSLTRPQDLEAFNLAPAPVGEQQAEVQE